MAQALTGLCVAPGKQLAYLSLETPGGALRGPMEQEDLGERAPPSVRIPCGVISMQCAHMQALTSLGHEWYTTICATLACGNPVLRCRGGWCHGRGRTGHADIHGRACALHAWSPASQQGPVKTRALLWVNSLSLAVTG